MWASSHTYVELPSATLVLSEYILTRSLSFVRAQTSNQAAVVFPFLENSVVTKTLFIVCFEHLIFLLKVFVDWSIDPVPGWVRVKLAKEEYDRALALRKLRRERKK